MSSNNSPKGISQPKWQLIEVESPLIDHPVSAVSAKGIPYITGANRFQNLNIYLPTTTDNLELIGEPATSLPAAKVESILPNYLVHIHGGAWRDPQLTATSIEPTVAHAFYASDNFPPLVAIVSINYTVSQFPTHRDLPYDAIKNNHSDISREAVHPQHVSDVLHALNTLRLIGLTDHSYVLSGHSCGACIAFQTVLQPPAYYGLDLPDAPAPAAILGLNGLYDLPKLVSGLDSSHQHLQKDYENMLSTAFGSDQQKWITASPARFDPVVIAERIREKKAPRLVVLDHSAEDQLVPMNQQDLFKAALSRVSGLRLFEGYRSTGTHAAPWQQGLIIWQSVQDILRLP